MSSDPAPDLGAAFRALAPTQQLVLEVLAARHRLGEPFWPFPRLHSAAVRSLVVRGLVDCDSAATGDLRVSLTDLGCRTMLAPGYVPPSPAAPAPAPVDDRSADAFACDQGDVTVLAVEVAEIIHADGRTGLRIEVSPYAPAHRVLGLLAYAEADVRADMYAERTAMTMELYDDDDDEDGASA